MEIPGFSLDLSGLEQGRRPKPNELYDLLVLGGGPAAMSAAIYAARKMMKLAILTKDFGGQVSWTSEVENYLGFQSISGKELVSRFAEQVRTFEVPTAKGEMVAEVVQEGGQYRVRLESGISYLGRSLIVATGKRDRPLGVPGEKQFIGRGVAYCSICDAPFYKDKHVMVVGGGNSAFTAALDLLKNNAQVTMVNWAEGWQADEVLVDAVDSYQAKVTKLDYSKVLRIEGIERVQAVQVQNRGSDKSHTITIDGVFVEIGLLPNSEFLRNLAKLNEQGELIVDCMCRTNVAGLFGAGDVTTVPHKQIVISAGEGAKAALSAYEYVTRLIG